MASDLTLSQKPIIPVQRNETPQNPANTQDRLKAHTADAERALVARRQQFVDRLAKMHSLDQGRLVIEKDPDTGKFIHKLVDAKTGDVVRQWPDDAWLEFARSMGGAPEGLSVNTKA